MPRVLRQRALRAVDVAGCPQGVDPLRGYWFWPSLDAEMIDANGSGPWPVADLSGIDLLMEGALPARVRAEGEGGIVECVQRAQDGWFAAGDLATLREGPLAGRLLTLRRPRIVPGPGGRSRILWEVEIELLGRVIETRWVPEGDLRDLD